MMATSVRPPDRQLRQLCVLLLVEFVSFIGLIASGLLVLTDVAHNARPLLSIAWCLFTAAILGTLVAVESQLPVAHAQGSGPIRWLRRVAFAILGTGSLALLATLLTMLASQPDPSLYRVPSAVAAARAAIDSLPNGVAAQIVSIESVAGVQPNSSGRAWHLELETDTKPRRIFDVTIDAKSGETYRFP